MAPAPHNPKANLFRQSMIAEIYKEAMQCQAVDLAMGAPDFPAPSAFKEAAVDAVRRDCNQYGNGWGIMPLREAIARKVNSQFGISVSPATEITVTCGATEGVFLALVAALEPGDEVILFEPFYESYIAAASLIGARPRFVRLNPPGWQFSMDELIAAVTPRTRAVVLNSPNNPTGKVFSKQELQAVAQICIDHNLICITDEIYEHIVFDGARHYSMLQLPEMRERTIVVSAASKSYSVTGWRIGWTIAPPAFTSVLRKTHELVTVAAPAPLQEATVVSLAAPESYYRELAAVNQKRRDYLISVLAPLGFTCLPVQGAFYLMAGIRALTDMDDVQFARFLIQEIGVATVPGSIFFSDAREHNDLLRFCFSKAESTLTLAAERLQALPARMRVHAEAAR